MKLLFHEKVLLFLTLVFSLFILLFPFNHKGELNIVAGSQNPAAPYLININTASARELQALSGIGEKTATAIVDYRNKNGDFKTTYELNKVPGIGNSTIEKIKDYIKV